jgi:hypothetical protein
MNILVDYQTFKRRSFIRAIRFMPEGRSREWLRKWLLQKGVE